VCQIALAGGPLRWYIPARGMDKAGIPRTVKGVDGETMLTIISIILRHKRTVVLITLAGFIVSALISLILPPRYVSSTAFMLVGVEEEITGRKGFFSQLGAFGEAYGVFVRTRRNFIIDFIVRSRRMSDLLDARFDLKGLFGVERSIEVREELRKRTRVEVRDEGVIIVSFEDRSPERARVLAEAYLHSVDSLLVEFTTENAVSRTRFLEAEVVRRERRIATADSALMIFLDNHGIFEIEQQARAAIRVATQLEARKQALRLEKDLLAMTLLPGSPQLERLERILDGLGEEITTVHEGSGSDLFPSLREVPGLASEYLRLYQELKIQEFALAFVRLKLEDEAILTNREVSVIRVIDPPVVPEKRVWPKRKQIVMISTLAVFSWVCFALIVRDRWREGAFAFNPDASRVNRAPDADPGAGTGRRGGG